MWYAVPQCVTGRSYVEMREESIKRKEWGNGEKERGKSVQYGKGKEMVIDWRGRRKGERA